MEKNVSFCFGRCSVFIASTAVYYYFARAIANEARGSPNWVLRRFKGGRWFYATRLRWLVRSVGFFHGDDPSIYGFPT